VTYKQILVRNLIFVCLLAFVNSSFSQDGNFIETEMIKVQQEFTSENPTTIEKAVQGEINIPQEELMQELMKPGNENLLEQIKGMGRIETIEDIDQKINDKRTEEEKKLKEEKAKQLSEQEKAKELEEEEKKMMKARATMDGLLFEDNYAYYQSIKDFYGYDIFLKFVSKSKESGLVLSNSNYVVGPGDELVLSLWGDTELQTYLRVNNDGTVYLKDIGIVSVHGYKLSDLQERFKNVLSKRYRTIAPLSGNPTTFFDIALSKLKTINIFVNGEVIVPGSYNISSYSTILDALKEANGVTAKGTLRDIILIREGKITSRLDIYDYLLSGKNVTDINLKNGDNIFVGPRLNTIQLSGEVLRPLKYELKNEETLNDLIKFSGGLLPTAAIDRVKIERILPFEQRFQPVVSTKIYDLEFTHLVEGVTTIKPIKLFNHDIVSVFQVPKLLTDYVSIGGAVYRKGRYAYKKDMTVSELLLRCGGVLSDAFMSRVELIRTYPNSVTEYVSLNLENGGMLYTLNNKDSIYIHSEWNLKSKKIVAIGGYIPKPGFYFLSDSTRISDLIFSKGGLEDKKQRDRTYMKRADLVRYNEDGLTTSIIPINLEKIVDGDKTEDIYLEDRDQLRIYGIGVIFEEPKVKITGYVKYEGEYPLSEKMTVEDLILKAHGFKTGAYKFKAVVFRLKKNRFETDSLSQVFDVGIDYDFLETGKISEKKFFLQPDDHVVIRKNPDFDHIRKVTISGEVKFPGVYSLTYRDENLKDIIERAGGLTHEAFLEGIVFQRDSIRIVTDFKKATSSSSQSIIMKDLDDVHVPKHPGIVFVEGFVYTPQKIAYRKDWSLSDYVEAAGGPIKSKDHKVGETVVYYPGGNARVDGWFFSPDVKEGSRIVVESVEKEPDSRWRDEIRSWLGIITSTITVLLLVQAANNNN